MAVNLIEKLLSEAVQTGGTYVEFVVSKDTISFICDGGSRKSTRRYRRSKNEIKEDERLLKTVSELNLLFSGQLSRITISFSNGRTAAFHKSDHNDICTITARRVTESKEKDYNYVCFTSSGDPCTGIAFALKVLKNGRYKIVPSAGIVMNGPNVTEMSSNLQFVISGGFHVNDGMPDENASVKNKEVIDALASEMEFCIQNIMHRGLLGMSFFSVLPNSMDEESFINVLFIQTIRNVSNYHPMFKNRRGTIVHRNSIAYGTEDVTKLFPQEIAGLVLGKKNGVSPVLPAAEKNVF